jgi:hypothetical protein
LDRTERFYKPPGRFTSKQKYRDLTPLRSVLPSSVTSNTPISCEDVVVFFRQVVTPQKGGTESDPESFGYPGGYCTVPVGTAAVPVLWVLYVVMQGTVGTVGTAQYPWVLQGTVGTAAVPVGTAGYCEYCEYCGCCDSWVLCVLLVGTAYV